ncbi:MAG: phosphopantetheine-binding protein [Verrucomicrobia bacterium]|nr:phosphopantetheine-binding protein [Verrucomicrobiota bacterium]
MAIAPEIAAEKLDGYPVEIIEAYRKFYQSEDPRHLDDVLFGLLMFLLAEPPVVHLSTLPDTAKLREDVGVDSITITEVIFLVEDLFEITVPNEDLEHITTIGDLRSYMRTKICS